MALPTDDQLKVLTATIPPSLLPLFLHNKLHPLLPWSLPLYRRCQFFLYQTSLEPTETHTTTSHKPGAPEVWVAVSSTTPTTDSTIDETDWLTSWLRTPAETATPGYSDVSPPHYSYWLASHIDMREPGQTQVWTFGSWEATISSILLTGSTTTTTPVSGDTTEEGDKIEPPTPTPAQTALGQALYHRLRTHHIPCVSVEPSRQYLAMKAAGKFISSPYCRSKVLFGTLAEASWWLVDLESVVKGNREGQQAVNTDVRLEVGGVHLHRQRNKAISREDRPYLKYILPLPPLGPVISSLPSGSDFRLASLEPSHLQTVLDRSPIPRSLELLKTLPSIGLFPVSQQAGGPDSSSTPIAWGILSKDASVSSLHTEDEYRGRGLAEVVTRKLIEVTASRFSTTQSVRGVETDVLEGLTGEEGRVEIEVPYAHTDISPENVASRRVFEKMGARVAWRVAWVEVDVGEDEHV